MPQLEIAVTSTQRDVLHVQYMLRFLYARVYDERSRSRSVLGVLVVVSSAY